MQINWIKILDKLEHALRPSRWKILLLILISATLTVFYIYNVYRVNDLMKEISNLKNSYDDIKYKNEILFSRSIKLQSADRIGNIAREKLKMEYPKKAPTVFTLDD